MLDSRVERKALRSEAFFGYWPAHSEGEDIVLGDPSGGGDSVGRFPMLRQQQVHPDDRPNKSLADLIAPADAGREDHLGLFNVAVHGAEEIAQLYEANGDDYDAIMVKALADRLAEATAEWLHRHARIEWGYESKSDFAAEDLLSERFRGIRPAFGARLPRPQPEASLTCSRWRHGPPDGPHGHDPRGVHQRLLLRPRLEVLAADSTATRSRTTPSARASACRRRKWLAPWLAYDV